MNEHLENLKEIRSLMEKSSKFFSLSGLSGISAGIVALVAAIFVYLKKVEITGERSPSGVFDKASYPSSILSINYIIWIAILTFLAALFCGIFFTIRKARLKNETVWNNLSKKLLVQLGIPIVSGALFCSALIFHDLFWLCPASSLVFYGLALVNASKYTVRDVYFLGLFEVAVGIMSLFITGYTLVFWAFGFGILHIFYGTIMYFKYEK